MKKIISAICLSILGMSLFAYDVASNSQLKGNVKSVTKINYTIASKFGDYFRTPNSKFVYAYGVGNQQISSTELTPRDVVVNKITIFNKKPRLAAGDNLKIKKGY